MWLYTYTYTYHCTRRKQTKKHNRYNSKMMLTYIISYSLFHGAAFERIQLMKICLKNFYSDKSKLRNVNLTGSILWSIKMGLSNEFTFPNEL